MDAMRMYTYVCMNVGPMYVRPKYVVCMLLYVCYCCMYVVCM